MAERIRRHFGTHRFSNVVGGAGIDVAFQGTLGSGVPVPLPVEWQIGCPIGIVAMIDRSLVENAEWVEHLHDLRRRAATEGFGARLLPVVMDSGILNGLKLDEQALHWDQWDSANEAREQRLIRELAYDFARMLRQHLQVLRQPDGDQPERGQYLEKIQTFLSHTKRDGHGKEVAEALRCWLHENSALSSFLDIYDIPGGLPFSDVIDHHIGKSVFLAIHTDHYSSSEWCRREVIEAKRRGVPMIVVDCLHAGDERAFPYLGNVPVVRMNSLAKDRLPEIVGRLLDEVLVNLLWSCRVEAIPERPTDTVFMHRPPEFVSLATLATNQDMQGAVVYPDPPLDKEEMRLFGATWSGLRVQTITQWLAEGAT